MDNVTLFPFVEYWWVYIAFVAGVGALLAIDLGVFHRDAHEVSCKEAGAWVTVWVSLALLFNLGLYQYSLWSFASDPRLLAIPGFDPEATAWRVALEFLTGYVVEESLSVDNIFVFVVVFRYFGIPSRYQHRVLFYGILGAFVFRTLFIIAGSLLMRYQFIIYGFGAFLIFTGVKLMFAGDQTVEPHKNPLIRLFTRFVPVTAKLEGQCFFVRKHGVLYGTPLVVTLLFLEATDIIFAVDSVPAVFAITSEPLIVFTSNLAAIMGLRSMYFLLAGAIDKFHLLKYGLAVVLVFVGLKMVWLNDIYDGHFPIAASLVFIVLALIVSIAASLMFPKASAKDV